MKKVYSLVVTYPGTRFGHGYDRKVERLVRKESTGSGFGFDGRDLDFEYKSKPAAYKAARKVRNHLSAVKAKVWTLDPTMG